MKRFLVPVFATAAATAGVEAQQVSSAGGGNAVVAADRESFTIKSNGWTWTYTPTPLP